MQVNKYYLTFGQTSPLKNGWITVHAPSEDVARLLVFKEYGARWSGLYPEDKFSPEYFPEGEKGIINGR